MESIAPEERRESTVGGETWPWQKVGLASGETGYVWGKYLRSPIDYRLGLEKHEGGWKIMYFVAGD